MHRPFSDGKRPANNEKKIVPRIGLASWISMYCVLIMPCPHLSTLNSQLSTINYTATQPTTSELQQKIHISESYLFDKDDYIYGFQVKGTKCKGHNRYDLPNSSVISFLHVLFVNCWNFVHAMVALFLLSLSLLSLF